MNRTSLFLSIALAFSVLSWTEAPPTRAEKGSPDVSVKQSLDKDFGFFIGDLVKVSHRLSLPPHQHLREDSIPGEGQWLGEWVEVRERRISETPTRDLRIYDIELTYQIFSASAVARTYEIPGVEFSYGPRDAPSQNSSAWPAVPVRVSPLTSSRDEFKPPIFWSWSSPSAQVIRFLGAGILLGSLGFAAFLFRRRVRRPSPFGNGLKRMFRQKDPQAALTVFRHVLNEKAGRAIFSNNLEDLYHVFPEARAHQDELLDLVRLSDEVSFNPESAAVSDGLLRKISQTMKKMQRLEKWA